MKKPSQIIYDEVGYNLSKNVMDLIESLDHKPIAEVNDYKEKFDKLEKENADLKGKIKELEAENNELRHVNYESEDSGEYDRVNEENKE